MLLSVECGIVYQKINNTCTHWQTRAGGKGRDRVWLNSETESFVLNWLANQLQKTNDRFINGYKWNRYAVTH